MEYEWIRQQICKEITKLKPEIRNVVLLKYVGQLKEDEIAETLDLPPGTVKSRIFYARKRLKSALHNISIKLIFLPFLEVNDVIGYL